MRLATRSAAGESVGPVSPALLSSPPSRALDGCGLDFEAFTSTLLNDLSPRSALERVLADRLALAAWRLHLVSLDETEAALDGEPLPPLSRETLRAERSLETALDLLETARAAVRPRWGHAAPAPARVETPEAEVDEVDSDLSEGDFSNEWPVMPAAQDLADDRHADDDEDGDDDEDVPARWQDRLVFDENVSDSSPVVKGTWVTVRQVVSLIVDGWNWSDVLRTHPELTEDDVRTCLAYTAELDDNGSF